MNNFIEFLKLAKQSSVNIKCNSHVHVVIGNESCDLDSMVSAFGLAYLNYLKNASLDKVITLPVLNINSNEMDFKTENCYVLRKVNVDSSFLIFRNDINLEKLQKRVHLTMSLVDHHVLSSQNQVFTNNVIEIVDHRPVDTSAVWSDYVKVQIEQVGSCTTLVAKMFLDCNYSLDNILAKLFYDVITFDTIGFDPKTGRAKELDINVTHQLVKKCCLEDKPKEIFEELWTAHNDVSHLTAKQLLYKDLKIVDGIPIPGLPMLVEEYLKRSDVLRDIQAFCEEKDSNTVVLIGLHVFQRGIDQQVCRDIAIYTQKNNSIAESIISSLRNANIIKGYDLGLEEGLVNLPGIIYFKQNNIKLTRKQIIPLVQEALQVCSTS